MDAASAPSPGAGHWCRGRADPLGERVARWRLRHRLLVQLVRYAIVGGSGTALTAGLFLLLRPWLDTFAANLVALVVSTAVSTEANRRFAFGGARAHRLREWVQDIGTVAFYAGYTSGVLVLLHLLVPAAGPMQEAVAVAVASVAGGIARFVVLRNWVFDAGTGRAHF